MTSSNMKFSKMEIDDEIPIMISVTAPSNMEEGFKFEAYVNGDKNRSFTCVVPSGGVQEGQTFMVPLPESEIKEDRIQAPTGKWKDGLCDCCAYGPCHNALLLAIWCPVLALGQVMQRMSLTWRGNFGDVNSTKSTFMTMVMIYLTYIVLNSVVPPLVVGQDDPNDTDDPNSTLIVLNIVQIFFWLWFAYSLSKTRGAVRKQYSIPGNSVNDCVASHFLPCCVLTQLSRHTGDYENRPSFCCTATGHPTAVYTV